MTAAEHSIIDAIKAIDQLRVQHKIVTAERDMLRRRLAEAQAELDTWRAKAVTA